MKTVMSYVEGDSFFHKLHPLTKFIWAILTCAASFMCKNLYLLAVIVSLNIAITLLAGIFMEAKDVLKMFFIIGLCLFIIQALCMQQGNVIFQILNYIKLTDKGITSGIFLALRMCGALLPLTLMIMLTPINDLTAEMEEKFHIPYKYTFVLTTTLKFIPMFSKEMEQIIQAQVCRGCDLDSKNVFKKLKMIIPMSIPLLVSSIRKIEKQAITLEIRGFNSPQRSRYKKPTASYKDGIAVCYIFVMMITAFIF